MTPKQVAEGHDDTGHELVGKSSDANGPGLETGSAGLDAGLPVAPNGSYALGQPMPPQESKMVEQSDIVSEEILSHASPLMRAHLQMLQEQYESCMQMHRHYKEIAVNGTEADMGPMTADDLALNYLKQASQISQNMTSMVNEMLRTSTKKAIEREKIKGKANQLLPEGAKVTQNNTVINFSEADQREKLRMMDSLAGKRLNGTLGIPTAQTLVDSIANTREEEKDQEQPDVE